jgi:thiol-disulfide isomerase/thioredoxin
MVPPLLKIGIRYLMLVSLCIPGAAYSSESPLLLELPGGQDFEVTRFSGAGKSLMLWLPSERGFKPAHKMHAAALADLGHEVWLADLHDIYFVEPGRASIERFPLADIVALIDAALASTDANLILVSSSRGAQLALIAAREWQLQNPAKARINGVILAHAHLYQRRPEIGSAAVYLPITHATNLPVYLIDAQYSTKSAQVSALATELGVGGSQVYTQLLTGVQGGFFARDDRDISEVDRAAKKAFAATLDRAARVLGLLKPPEYAFASNLETVQFSAASPQTTSLKAVSRPFPAPPLELNDFHGSKYTLAGHDQQVVLVNFWASWCRPCVKEIPSLHRLQAKIKNPAFSIVTVNVGENRERIAGFLEQVPMELPLLMDYDGKVSTDWKIYVYPSTYLVDHQGKIRYAYLGALEWDSTETIKMIQSLLNGP